MKRLFRFLGSRLRRHPRQGRNPQRFRTESLEERLVLSTYSVINTANSGAGSLRQAILDANANAGADTIEFNIGGGGTQTIAISSALPIITDTLTIDGSTQPGFAGSPLIAINATGVPSNILRVSASNSVISDLAIQNANGTAVVVTGAANTILRDLDLSWTGTGSIGTGVSVGAGSSNTTIENVAVRNRFRGMDIDGDASVQISGADFSGDNQGLRLRNMTGVTLQGPIGVGFGTVFTTAIDLANVDDATIRDIDLSWTGSAAAVGTGLLVGAGSSNTTIENVAVRNRFRGMDIDGDASVQISGADFSGDNQGLRLRNMTGVTLQGPIGVGFGTVFTTAIDLANVHDATIRDLDLSWTGSAAAVGTGLLVGAGSSNTTIENVAVRNRFHGMDIDGDASVQISGADFSGDNQGLRLRNMTGVTLQGPIGVGFGTVFTTAIDLANVHDATIRNLDLSWTGSTGRLGTGLLIGAGSSNAAVEDLFVNNRSRGIDVSGSTVVEISCSSLQGNTTGLNASSSTSQITLFDSQVDGNTVGVANAATAVLLAEFNYWGAANGPSNLGGSGDSYTGHVDADPFLTGLPDCLVTNVAPTANAGGAYTTNEGSSLTLDASASFDPDDDPLTYRWDVDGDGDFDENVSGVNPTLTVSALSALGLTDGTQVRNVTVEVSDGTQASTASTTLTINNVVPTFEAGPNETLQPPAAGAFSRSGLSISDPGSPETFSGTVNFGDGSGSQTLTINQALRMFDLSHVYPNSTSEPNVATYTVTVVVNDGDGGSHTDTFDVTVILNTPPVANPDAVSTDEDHAVTFSVLGNDTDGEGNIVASQTIALTNPAAGILTNNGNGTFTYNPNGLFQSLAVGQSAQVSFNYRITDAFGDTSVASAVITIHGVNDAPVAEHVPTTIVNQLLVNSGFETVETITGGTGSLTTTGDWAGDVSTIVTAQNGITPAAGSRMLRFDSTQPTTPAGVGNSAEVFQLVNLAPYASAIAAGNFTLELSALFNRVAGDSQTDRRFEVNIFAYDGLLSSFPTQITNLTHLLRTNSVVDTDAVTSTWQSATTIMDVPVGTDFVAVMIAARENIFNDTTPPEFDGHFADSVRLRAYVGGFLTTTEIGPPVTAAFDADDPDSDDDPSTLTYTVTQPPTGGSVVNHGDGTFTFDPENDFSFLTAGQTQLVNFNYVATDSHGAVSNTATVSVLVTGLNNSPPVARDDDVSTDEDTPLLINVLADNGHGADSEADGNLDLSQTISLSTPSAGTLTNIGNGTFSYDPNGDFESLAVGESAQVSFDYQIADAFGATSSATVTITINGVNDVPQITNAGIVTINEGQTATHSGTWFDIDASDLVSLSASIGIVTKNANGTWGWSFDSSDGPDQSQTVIITANDGHGGIVTSSFELTVNNVAPAAAVSGPASALAGSAVSFTLDATDISSADQAASFTYNIDWDGDGTVDQSISGADGFVVSHAFGTAGSTTVIVTATDKDGGVSLEASHTLVLIQPVNIDVKPDSSQNKVNVKSQGVIPVAILTTAGFNAATVVGSSVRLAGVNASQFALEDVDRDGDLDMILHFRTQDVLDALGLTLNSGDSVNVSAKLTGETIDQVMIEGIDTINFFLTGNGSGKK